MKIYDWRRFITFIAIVLLLIITILAIKNKPSYEVAGTFNYYVNSGETIWSIASQFRPENMDIREYMDLLIAENDIKNCFIYPDQELKIIQMKEVK